MEEPPRKRRNLTSSWKKDEGNGQRSGSSSPTSSSGLSNTSSPETSASSASPPRPACGFSLEIEKFIPVGCLRVERCQSQITAEVWTSCSEWRWLGHPGEIIIPKNGLFLQDTIQEALWDVSNIAPYRSLHRAGWIRSEFKMRDAEWGQIRVHILPQDISRGMIERYENSLRRSLQRLVAEIDTSKTTWGAEWTQDTPVVHLDTDLNRKDIDVSLFYLFNTLPSPTPDPSLVRDPYTRDAMCRIMNGKVSGLKTTMLAYQRRSAAMMLQKETQPSQFVDPRLRKFVDHHGSVWYCDITTGTCLRTPRMYEAARGGICAETMGLGKTLICLALILATHGLSSEIPVEYSLGTIPVRTRVGSLLDMSGSAIGRTGTPWKEYVNELEEDGSDYSRCKEAIRRGAGHYCIPPPTPIRLSRNPINIPPRKIHLSTATLVVVPANLVRQWEREIEKHTAGLKVLVMRSNQSQLPPAIELAGYDVILFSRQRFDQESKDGTDQQGRRPSSGGRQLMQSDTIYHSPLRDIHFKRLITDEGHTMGNAKSTTKTNALIVVDSLQLTSRWIISGTPTKGLYGVDSSLVFEEDASLTPSEIASLSSSRLSYSNNILVAQDAEQERKDLEKLGNIAATYLKSRPWANARYDQDFAAWSQYVMQPRHGSRSRGNLDCLRKTLEGMIIRHRPEDVEKDIVLPPLHQKLVYLEGSVQDKISLNLFSLVITSNAVQSERQDADYLFHPRSRKALGELVGNLRQASFFWCGFTETAIESAIQLARNFLEKGEIYTSEEDKHLLQKVVEYGEKAMSNPIWRAASKHHEMPIYVQNGWASSVRNAWALDLMNVGPTLLGSTQLLALQSFVRKRQIGNRAMDGLEDAGKMARAAAIAASYSLASHPKVSRIQKKLYDSPALARGVRIGDDLSPRKRRKPSSPALEPTLSGVSNPQDKPVEVISGPATPIRVQRSDRQEIRHELLPKSERTAELLSTAEMPNIADLSLTVAKILSTASSKLSYLVGQILMYQKSEKIIVFYEADNVAYYLAQVLEAVNVEHLIYAKSLSPDRRSSYIVTFNQSPRFRVLLMDISQAAFGLDVSSASRVYFINPVFNKQVEAQAVKRAHRIGQFRDVYVETLVLRGSIEEVIIERRKVMSSDEQKKCKSVLDDKIMYDWIKNPRFVSLPHQEIPSLDQMAMLQVPQPISAHNMSSNGSMDDPDAGILDFTPSPSSRRKDKRKATSIEETLASYANVELEKDSMIVLRPSAKKHSKRVTFEIDVNGSPKESLATNALDSLQNLRQLNTYPYPCGSASAVSEEFFSARSSRESSPSKFERSRIDAKGTRPLLTRFRQGKSPSPSPGVGASSAPPGSRASP